MCTNRDLNYDLCKNTKLFSLVKILYEVYYLIKTYIQYSLQAMCYPSRDKDFLTYLHSLAHCLLASSALLPSKSENKSKRQKTQQLNQKNQIYMLNSLTSLDNAIKSLKSQFVNIKITKPTKPINQTQNSSSPIKRHSKNKLKNSKFIKIK